jgi:hypothetical protein
MIVDGIAVSPTPDQPGSWRITGWRKGDGTITQAGILDDNRVARPTFLPSDGWERITCDVEVRYIELHSPNGAFDRLFWFAEYLNEHGSPA